MTSNEKKALMKFTEIKQANTVTIAGTLRASIGYAYDVCKNLCETGYLEKLSPGRFALYKITSLGETQVGPDRDSLPGQHISPLAGISNEVRGEGEGQTELGVGAGTEEVKREVEETEEYECTNCGTTVRKDEIECPKCGIAFEGYEGEPEEAFAPAQNELREETPQPIPRNEVLDHSSVPEDWKTCNWKWT